MSTSWHCAQAVDRHGATEKDRSPSSRWKGLSPCYNLTCQLFVRLLRHFKETKSKLRKFYRRGFLSKMEYDGKDKPASTTGGVKAFPIEGRFASERERLAGGFTDGDRAWRAKYLKDQILHDEPVTPEWFYKERYNPIRRLYRWPLETIFRTQEHHVPWIRFAYRYWTGKALLFAGGAYAGWYILKYHSNDWQNQSGFESVISKPFKPMGVAGHGEQKTMKPADYYDNAQGLDKSPI